MSRIVEKYASRFFVSVSISSIQGDHIHLLVKTPKRGRYFDFLRVVPGQIAQVFRSAGALSDTQVTDTPGTGLWKHRPFTRVVRTYRDLHGVRAYIQLNEKEARGEILYRKERLKGTSTSDWRILWS